MGFIESVWDPCPDQGTSVFVAFCTVRTVLGKQNLTGRGAKLPKRMEKVCGLAERVFRFFLLYRKANTLSCLSS